MKKKINTRLLGVTMITLLLVGCGQAAGNPAENTVSTEQAVPAESTASTDSTGTAGSTEPAAGTAASAAGETLSDTVLSASDASVVYMTTDISPEGLMAIYEALGSEPTGKVAVKVHTGEPGGKNFLRPEFMQELVQKVDGTIIESNTAYGGQRASTAMHYQVAEDHGFTAIAPVVILDEESSLALPVPNATHFEENLVGARLAEGS